MAENTRELKRRMRSIESTEHITNAMRLVSAAKFRKAKSLFDQKSLQLREVTETRNPARRRPPRQRSACSRL